jgi:tight adherence protein C
MDFLISKLSNPQFLFSLLVAIAAAATVFTIAMPMFNGDTLKQRMKSVGDEREKIRMRERERLSKQQKVSLRSEQKVAVKNFVENFNLAKLFGNENSKEKLLQAGLRSNNAEMMLLIFRMLTPIVFFVGAIIYVFVILKNDYNTLTRIGMCIAGAYLGLKAPEIYLSNMIGKRQLSIRRAWPDALDLLLICAEAGMSIENAFRRVSQEVGSQSVALAEELTLTTAELSYLQERRQAYENLGMRTGLDAVKGVMTALIQAEKYGTPVGTALRVLAQESRDQRMNDAEKKAAALPPKLTVPMILFFLPVLFVVILIPAVIQVYHWN